MNSAFNSRTGPQKPKVTCQLTLKQSLGKGTWITLLLCYTTLCSSSELQKFIIRKKYSQKELIEKYAVAFNTPPLISGAPLDSSLNSSTSASNSETSSSNSDSTKEFELDEFSQVRNIENSSTSSNELKSKNTNCVKDNLMSNSKLIPKNPAMLTNLEKKFLKKNSTGNKWSLRFASNENIRQFCLFLKKKNIPIFFIKTTEGQNIFHLVTQASNYNILEELKTVTLNILKNSNECAIKDTATTLRRIFMELLSDQDKKGKTPLHYAFQNLFLSTPCNTFERTTSEIVFPDKNPADFDPKTTSSVKTLKSTLSAEELEEIDLEKPLDLLWVIVKKGPLKCIRFILNYDTPWRYEENEKRLNFWNIKDKKNRCPFDYFLAKQKLSAPQKIRAQNALLKYLTLKCPDTIGLAAYRQSFKEQHASYFKKKNEQL